MLAKKKVYIMNQGVFNFFGYHNLILPAIVDLTENQLEFVKEQGYAIEEFSGNAAPEYNTIPSVGFASVINKREYENIMTYKAPTPEEFEIIKRGNVPINEEAEESEESIETSSGNDSGYSDDVYQEEV